MADQPKPQLNGKAWAPGDELVVLPLGGAGEIGMNATLYGCRGQWLMLDCGLTFAGPEHPGVDLLLPDLGFIERQSERLAGIMLTHGHEDHIGAVPYLAADLGAPLYATPFAAALVRRKLADEGLDGKVRLAELSREGTLELGPFRLRLVELAHSIPEAQAVVIDTPHGRVFHTGDWKLDEAPLLADPASEAALAAIGDEGVDLLVGDSTNVFERRPTGSESDVRAGLMEVVGAAGAVRVVVTTFASNLARVATLGVVAQATGRRLALVGRALERIVEVGRQTGHLEDFPPTMNAAAAARLPRGEVLVAATGTQGEPRAALARMADGTHPDLALDPGDVVVYSSRHIPGNERAIAAVQNALAARGCVIVNARDAEVHVSGHPARPEIEAMLGWLRPRLLVPVHGERRHLEEHARLALACGVPQAIVIENGTALKVGPGEPEILDSVPHGRLMLDGDVILPADGATMQARRRLAAEGHVSVAVALAGGRLRGEASVAAAGLPVEEEEAAFLADCRTAVADALDRDTRPDGLEERLAIAVRRVARRWTGKRPLVQVHVLGR